MQVAQYRRDMIVSRRTMNQSGGSVEDRLQTLIIIMLIIIIVSALETQTECYIEMCACFSYSAVHTVVILYPRSRVVLVKKIVVQYAFFQHGPYPGSVYRPLGRCQLILLGDRGT